MGGEVVFDGRTHWSVEFNGVKYPVTHYGLNDCSFYTDMDTGEDVMYTAPRVHLGDGYHGETGGEMDLPIDMSWEDAKGIANHVAECCGYLARWNDEKRTIKMYGQYQVYRVTFSEDGRIINIENITLETKIEALVDEINRMIRELNSAIGGGLDKVHGLSLNEFEAWIDQKKFVLDDMKEQLDVQTGNG